MNRVEQIEGVQQTLVEAFLFHQKRAKYYLHHEKRCEEIKKLYNILFAKDNDFEKRIQDLESLYIFR